jgi:hypothetical protein
MWSWKFSILRQVALIASLSLVVVSNGKAETELQKFESTVPPKAGFWFAVFGSCALTEGKGTSFAQIEAEIEKACKKHLEWAERELAAAGFDETKRRTTINQFKSLAANERRLRYEKKAIPGYVMHPLTAEVMECLRTITSLKKAYGECVDQALQDIIPSSNDSSDVIADAAMGICEFRRSEMATTTSLCFSGDQSKAENAVSSFARQLRSSALGKVVALRAEMSRRQSMPTPTPLPPTKSERGI